WPCPRTPTQATRTVSLGLDCALLNAVTAAAEPIRKFLRFILPPCDQIPKAPTGGSPVQYVPERSAKDVRLRCSRNSALIEHPVITLEFAIEFVEFAFENVRPKNQLLKRCPTRFRSMRAGHACPPEDRFEKSIVFLLLDQRRARH